MEFCAQIPHNSPIFSFLMSVQKLIASLCYIVCVLPTLNKTYLFIYYYMWFRRLEHLYWLILFSLSPKVSVYSTFTTSVDTEMCCPKGKCGCQYFILLT